MKERTKNTRAMYTNEAENTCPYSIFGQ